MSAPILRRGDVIHLALPISPALYDDRLRKQIAEDQRLYNEGYSRFGVTIGTFTHHSSLTVPTVVAIFRTDGQVAP